MLYSQMNDTDKNELFYSLVKAVDNVYKGQIPNSGIIAIHENLIDILKENEKQQCYKQS